MIDSPVVSIIWIVSFVVLTVAVTGMSRRVGWSAPVALVAVGAACSFVPGVPEVQVDPDIVLFGLLPPILFAAAIRTSYADVRARNDSILLLSVGLVAFTVVVVGVATWLVVPAISLAAAFAFGAVVAPTDAVAVTAVAGRLRLPRRMVTVLEGESLLNDATALVALNAAITAIVAVLNPWAVAGEFVLAVVAGAAVGLLVGYVLSAIRKRLSSPVLDTSLALVTPYLAFIPAQLIHGSGVLAVVVAGLFLGLRSPAVQSAEARIAESINWRTIQFLLENAIFLFIGLSLASIARGAAESGIGIAQTAFISVVVLLVLFLSRLVWMIVLTSLYRYGPSRLRERSWNWNNAIAIAFAGIRGVVTLAAVFLLPEETPGRAFLQLLAFIVVAGSLLEGLALPFVIRRLKLPPPNFDQERTEKHNLLIEAQAAGLSRLDAETDEATEERVLQRLRTDANFLADALANPGPTEAEPSVDAYRRLRELMIDAERAAVVAAQREGRYQDRAVRAVLAIIDAEETSLRRQAPEGND